MRSFAWLLILAAIAASRRSGSVLLRDQPQHWPGGFLAILARLLGA